MVPPCIDHTLQFTVPRATFIPSVCLGPLATWSTRALERTMGKETPQQVAWRASVFLPHVNIAFEATEEGEHMGVSWVMGVPLVLIHF